MIYPENCCLLLLMTCYLTAAALNDPCGRNGSIDVHIIGFFPCTDPNDTRGIPVDNCDGIERIPIMKLALEEINERCDLLPGYRLVVDYANSACSSIPATYHLIQQTDPSRPTKLMILGTACSSASHLMGEIAQRKLHIPQVAYTASDSVFGIDKTRYPRFYRLVPITEQVTDGYLALLQELNWKRAAVISYDDDFNINLLNYTAKKLMETGVNVILAASFADDDPSLILTRIKKLNARIIIAWIPHHIAVKFWCTVIKNRLAGSNFVWFLPGWFRPNWWAAVDGTDCTAEEMSRSLEHSLGGLGNSVVDTRPSRTLVSNKNVTQFKDDLKGYRAVKTDIFLNFGYVYNAVWTIALALNSSISILEERELGRLEDFTYDSVEMADVFTEIIANVSFEGISGKVSYQQNGNRNQPSVQLRQYQDGKAVPVLVYDPSDSSSKFYDIKDQRLIWQGGSVPRDAPVPVVLSSTTAECAIASVMSSFGILSTIFFFVFNISCRKHPIVKRSSYRLNSLILAGVCIGFIGTLLHVIHLAPNMPTAFTTAICNLRIWTSTLAFGVAFGALSVKILRLYKVFVNKRMVQRNYLNDRFLFLLVAIILAPTVVVLIVQVAAFPLTLHTTAVVNEKDFSTEEIYSECSGSHKFVFLSLTYAEGVILGLFSMLVAYETQKNIPKHGNFQSYNESAVINLTTIFAVLLSSICQAVVIILQLNEVKDGVLLLITLRDCLWMYPIIYLLFVPKVYKVCRRSPSGTNHRRQIQYPSLASNPLYSTRTRASISSLSSRRGSAATVCSERRSSYQFQGQPNAGVLSRRRNSEMHFKQVTFSAILEHSEEALEPNHSEDSTSENKVVELVKKPSSSEDVGTTNTEVTADDDQAAVQVEINANNDIDQTVQVDQDEVNANID